MVHNTVVVIQKVEMCIRDRDIVPQCIDRFVDIAIAGSKGMGAIKIPKAKRVGDLYEIVPRLIERIKAAKGVLV